MNIWRGFYSWRCTGRFGAAWFAALLAAVTSLPVLLAGCSGKGPETITAAAPTNQARPGSQLSLSEEEPVLSASDAAVLKGGLTGPQKPASEADRAWDEVAQSLRPPSVPPEWELKEPTKEEIAAFEKTNGMLAAMAADKVKDFYTRFPNHEKAADARQHEYDLLTAAVQLGNTNRLEQLRKLEEARLKDPSLSEDDRFELRVQQLQRTGMDDKQTNVTVSLKQMEQGARALKKEFPKRAEAGSLLLSVAQGWLDYGDAAKSRALAREVAEGATDDELKTGAQELLKKIERVGKPLELKFKAVDGRAIDLQKMKGQVVLLDFWATWCGPCMAELPNVKAAYEKLHSKGFEILGISFDREQASLDRVLAKEKMIWPQYFDDGEDGKKLGDEFGITGIPTMWLVDKKGVLRELNARDGLLQKVEKLLAEK